MDARGARVGAEKDFCSGRASLRHNCLPGIMLTQHVKSFTDDALSVDSFPPFDFGRAKPVGTKEKDAACEDPMSASGGR